jgi:hypothetical protein
LIRFKNQIGRHCAAGPTCQRRIDLLARAHPRTPSLPARPRGRPALLVSHARPAAHRCSAATPPPVRAAAGPLPPDAASLHCPRGARAPSLSPPLCPMHRPMPRTPSVRVSPPPPPFKRALPPAAGRIPPPPASCFSSRFDATPAAISPPPPLAVGPPRGRCHPVGVALPLEHRRTDHFPPPHRRLTSSVSPVSALLARRHPGTPPVLAGRAWQAAELSIAGRGSG